MVNEARYLAWNWELKTRLSDIVSHLHILNNYRHIVTQQLKKKVFLQCHVKLKCFQNHCHLLKSQNQTKAFSTKWQFRQLTLKWLSGVRAQDKNKQYYCCFFFSFFFFIQFCDSGKIYYLTPEFRVKLHLKTGISVFACNLARNRPCHGFRRHLDE